MARFNGTLSNRWVNWIDIKKRYWIKGKHIHYIDIQFLERIKQFNGYNLKIGRIYIARQECAIGHSWTFFEFAISDKTISSLCLFGIWLVSSYYTSRDETGHLVSGGFDVRETLWGTTRTRRKV